MLRATLSLVILSLALLLSLGISLTTGPYDIGPGQVWNALFSASAEDIHRTIVQEIRLPRSLLALLVGAALSVAGAAFQAVLRNPLADPYILGVSGGAALGAVSAFALGMWLTFSVPVLAFGGALLALLVVYLVGGTQRTAAPTLILAGVMVGSLAAALLLFVLWSMPADSVRGAIFWLAGDLSAENTRWLLPGAVGVLLACGGLWLMAPALDIFTQGEESAADLGLSVAWARLGIFFAAGLLTATAVALAGLIGFVGLVIPHVVRLLWGPNHRFLLPASALLGATFLLLADTIARTIFAPAQLPVGVITAIIGAPCFLYLLRRREVHL
ncbi:transport system permease protein [Desulfurispirillum indicum S5]|uniref:Transport system permease protein n=1 Tax=Desulfurispirillum indicum (strain ATCC BAA-1389 / DSM 22839 / S5) TaxID=653733 RepID=E6W0C0_DESIS|nr:iron ABC transporter permease [Desulfurispirillum indicum]ADU66338.1 transport system permease protein [Desulfurispirillum indicum S5]